MTTAATTLRMLVRITGLAQIVLGVLFWLGIARTLVAVHMLVGLVLVVCLWALAIVAARAGAPAGQVVFALVWGLIVVALGLTQIQLLPGSLHWVVQVLHLLVGMFAVGQGEGLGRAVLQRRMVAA